MSVHATAKVWRSRIEPTEKLVLLALADCAEHDGSNSFPSVPRLAAECGLSERTVQRVLRALEAKGWIVVEHEAGAVVRGVRRRSATYRLLLEALPARAWQPHSLPSEATQTDESAEAALAPPMVLNATQEPVEHGCHGVTHAESETASASSAPLHGAEGHSGLSAIDSGDGCHDVTHGARDAGEGDTGVTHGVTLTTGMGDTGVTQSVLESVKDPSPPYPPTTSPPSRSTDPSLGSGTVSDRSSSATGGAQTSDHAHRSGPPPVGTGEEARQGGAGGELGVIPDWLEPRRHAGVPLAEVERFRRILASGIRRFGEARMRSWFVGLELVSLSGTEAILGAGSYQATQLVSIFGDWLQAELGVRPRFVDRSLPPLPAPIAQSLPKVQEPERRRRRA